MWWVFLSQKPKNDPDLHWLIKQASNRLKMSIFSTKLNNQESKELQDVVERIFWKHHREGRRMTSALLKDTVVGILDSLKIKARQHPLSKHHGQKFVGRKIRSLRAQYAATENSEQDLVLEALAAKEIFVERMRNYESMAPFDRFTLLMETYVPSLANNTALGAEMFAMLSPTVRETFNDPTQVPDDRTLKMVKDFIEITLANTRYARATPKERYMMWASKHMCGVSNDVLEDAWPAISVITNTFEADTMSTIKVTNELMVPIRALQRERNYAKASPFHRFNMVVMPLLQKHGGRGVNSLQIWNGMENKALFDSPTMPSESEMQIIAMMASMVCK